MTAPVPDHASLPVEQLRRRLLPPPTIDDVVFWDCSDPEQLTHDNIEDAVEYFVDNFLSPGCDTEKVLREDLGGLTVKGYTRAEVTDKFLDGMADHLAERFHEQIHEDEWGDPNGTHENITPEGMRLLEEKLRVVLREIRPYIQPWACEVTTEVKMDADELVAFCRELRPQWFEKEGA